MDHVLKTALKKMRPASAYIDPAIFVREMETIFRKSWICVGRTEELSESGSFIERQLDGESILLVRGQDSVIRSLYNVCRHRGTRLCTEKAGRFNGTIQCSYHAWTWGLDGTLRAAPHFSDLSGFKNEDYPLHSTQCAEWGGNIFINLSKESPPLEHGLNPLMEKFAPWRMKDLRLGRRVKYEIAANWKLIIQNYSECMHCPTVHPALPKISHYMSGDNEPANPYYLGGSMTLNEGIQTMTLSGQTDRAVFSRLSADERRRVYFYSLLPNLLLSLHPDYVVTYTLWPIAYNCTDLVCEFHFDPEEMSKPSFTADDAFEFWDLTNRQDWTVSELSQLGMASQSYTPGPYSSREGLLGDFDDIISKNIDAQ